jgi:undecaprenyl-diphosphatase
MANPLFDNIMLWVREASFWWPLYLFFFAFVLLNFGRKGFFWVVFFILTVAVCDQAGGFIKHWIQRPRPCNDPFMSQFIKLRLAYCSPSFSFTSNHAANHFGIAIFIHRTFKEIKGFKTWWLFIWAAIVCYAQMYVGIHYPTDIIGGMFLGLFSGAIIAKIYNIKFKLYPDFPIPQQMKPGLFRE